MKSKIYLGQDGGRGKVRNAILLKPTKNGMLTSHRCP